MPLRIQRKSTSFGGQYGQKGKAGLGGGGADIFGSYSPSSSAKSQQRQAQQEQFFNAQIQQPGNFLSSPSTTITLPSIYNNKSTARQGNTRSLSGIFDSGVSSTQQQQQDHHQLSESRKPSSDDLLPETAASTHRKTLRL